MADHLINLMHLLSPADLADSLDSEHRLVQLTIRLLIALAACLAGLVVALVAGILTKRSQRLHVAIAAGGGAFAATVLLWLALFSFVLSP